ncbi:hypothetical protein ROA7450_03348 [Roseovarius albus]|uniref:Uncharacterized protein n=1 Tax=Roseovarius albus TaxID=1247867 RepID=A0A1X6ZYS4_9RHOB|nr:hypothetical protein [Roseovarius albus]SLN63782.1 hypothetical protein ROA7450_03348 [Roseovarius albus]
MSEYDSTFGRNYPSKDERPYSAIKVDTGSAHPPKQPKLNKWFVCAIFMIGISAGTEALYHIWYIN